MALSSWSIAWPKEILVQQNLSTWRAHEEKKEETIQPYLQNQEQGPRLMRKNVKFAVEF